MAPGVCIGRGPRASRNCAPTLSPIGTRTCRSGGRRPSRKNNKGGPVVTVDTKAIEKVITIAARPETVFRLLTDPSQYVRWKGKLAELEPRPGGTFHVGFQNGKDIVDGRFVEVIPSRRVVFTWGWRDNPVVPPGSSTVEIDLEPDGQGTRLRPL